MNAFTYVSLTLSSLYFLKESYDMGPFDDTWS